MKPYYRQALISAAVFVLAPFAFALLFVVANLILKGATWLNVVH